ncbi:MAG: hypothetical protein ACRERC_06460 [Candidatus Binatia bacterium]
MSDDEHKILWQPYIPYAVIALLDSGALPYDAPLTDEQVDLVRSLGGTIPPERTFRSYRGMEPKSFTSDEMEDTLAYLAALMPADTPAIHRERLRTIRAMIEREGYFMRCG